MLMTFIVYAVGVLFIIRMHMIQHNTKHPNSYMHVYTFICITSYILNMLKFESICQISSALQSITHFQQTMNLLIHCNYVCQESSHGNKSAYRRTYPCRIYTTLWKQKFFKVIHNVQKSFAKGKQQNR